MSHSQEQLTEILKAVVSAMKEADIKGDIEEIAFAKAFDFMTGTGSLDRGRTEITHEDDKRDDREDSPSGIAAIAKAMRIDPDAVARVFELDEDGAHLIVARSQLSEQKRVAMQEVARLISAARQGAILDEEWTPIGAVRSACDNLGVLDASNFATAVGKIQNDGVRFRGAGRNRELKVNAGGFETAGELVKRLANG